MSTITKVQKVFEKLWIFLAVFCVGNAIYEFVGAAYKKGAMFLGVACLAIFMYNMRKKMRLRQEARKKNN